ncbi:unnamed protein product [Owenia fusiformis]|uniref:Uncharacterized protein n=1 Tax=Owenia fusiformis TaxID=6347 RepID=A0A8S4MWT7_OWEFU|nr:unnamed protein product [Owenia fusiformis]
MKTRGVRVDFLSYFQNKADIRPSKIKLLSYSDEYDVDRIITKIPSCKQRTYPIKHRQPTFCYKGEARQKDGEVWPCGISTRCVSSFVWTGENQAVQQRGF